MHETEFLSALFEILRRGGRDVLMILHAVVARPFASDPYRTGTEHAGPASQSPSSKRCDVFGGPHDG